MTMKRPGTLSLGSHDIELKGEHSGIGPELQCPRCGSGYLHHAGVTVFDRWEDAEVTAVTTVGAGMSATHLRPTNEVANPSARHDGIAVAFECEMCGGDIELTMAQHKGGTYPSVAFCTEAVGRVGHISAIPFGFRLT